MARNLHLRIPQPEAYAASSAFAENLGFGGFGDISAITPGSASFGPAQKKKLSEVLTDIKRLRSGTVSIDDVDEQYSFALTVRDLVIQFRSLVTPILPIHLSAQLHLIHMNELDFESASRAWAKLDALVPAVEDALASINSRPEMLLTGSLEHLLQEQGLETVSSEFKRALCAVENDPPVAITASRAAIEALLKTYITKRKLTVRRPRKIAAQLKAAMGDLGLDRADRANTDMRQVLQGLVSVVHGLADLRTHGGSAHGHGKHSPPIHAIHARLAIHAAQTFTEFFVATWNSRKDRH